MKPIFFPVWLLLVLLSASMAATAQNAPGEDPVVLGSKVTYNFLPLNNQKQSGGMDASTELPSWLRAKLSRYQAKAFANVNSDDIYTDEDVVSTVRSDGIRTTCVQEVGTSTATTGSTGSTHFNRYGPKPDEQVVVLRGDLINICN